MNVLRVGLLAVCFSASISAQSASPSAPFGLTMGMSEAQVFRLLGLRPDQTGSVTTRTVPKPDRAFETYRLRVSPALGLCRVSGIGRNIAINPAGTRLKSAFTALVSQLTERYGTPSGVVDRLDPQSLLVRPDDWTSSLLRAERTLSTYWDPPANAADLSGISVRALALNRTTGYLLVAYEGKDYKLCRDEAEQRGQQSR